MNDTNVHIAPNWLTEARENARRAFNSLPSPDFKYGLQVFFPPGTVALPFASDAKATGVRATVRAQDDVIVLPFGDAIRVAKYEAVLRDILGTQPADRLAAWHATTGCGGIFVHVPKGAKAEPIRIDNALVEALRADHLVVYAEEGSRVVIVEHLYSKDGAQKAVRYGRTDMIAMPGAAVTYISVQNVAVDVADFSVRKAKVMANASVKWVDCAFGGDFVYGRTHTDLVEPGARVTQQAMFFGAGSQRFDLSHDVRHLASATSSDLKTRGALDGAAKAIVRGLVRIEKGTVGCDGRQKEDALLLSDRAEVDTIPNLEINAADVRCGHGATVGRVDADRLFYLTSRGLDTVAAKKMLLEGFFAPLVAEMRDSGLEDMVECLIAGRVDAATAPCRTTPV